MGRVWLVQHIHTSDYYVMKECTQVKEALMLERIHHPNIPQVFAYCEANGYVYMMMEYIDGKTLTQVIQESGYIKEKDVGQWMLQVIDIVCYLHEKQILYCDMKPENIILSKKGTIHLIDFGIAIDKEHQEGPHYGTIGYAAKEQYDEDVLDERVDIYGVAKVMLALLSGVFDGEKLQHLPLSQIHVSQGLRNIIAHCIAEDKDARYQCMMSLKQDLEKHMRRTSFHTIMHRVFHPSNFFVYNYE